MSSRRNRRGNKRLRLEKTMQEQRALENELEKLQSAKDQEQSANEIKQFIKDQGNDPMLSLENPFKQNQGGGCCNCSIL